MGTFTIRKMIAARTRIRGCKGHYMGFRMGVFFEIGGYTGLDLRGAVKQGECPTAGRQFSWNPQLEARSFLEILINRSGDFSKSSARDPIFFENLQQLIRRLSGILSSRSDLFRKSSAADLKIFRNPQLMIGTFQNNTLLTVINCKMNLRSII